jgi:anti-anti-sigma factor
MRITIQTQSGVPVVTVGGEFDMYTAKEFRAAVGDLGTRHHKVLMDCTELSYLDSSGVGAIIQLATALLQKKGVLAVVGLGGAPKKVLQMSNIITLLKEYPDKFQALKELMN